MELYTIIISGLALLFSIFTFWFYGKKINDQTKLINSYNIQKIQEEKEDKRKAKIEASYTYEGKGNATIYIYNKGKAIAKSVDVIIPNDDEMDIMSNPLPMDIKPQHSVKIPLALGTGHPSKITLKFKWSDEFAENNIDYQEIQLT